MFLSYAVLSDDCPAILSVLSGSADAGTAGGDPHLLPALAPGCCLRVNTGGPVPKGEGVGVAQVEDTRLVEATEDGSEEIRVEVLRSVAPGEDIRPKGCDVKEGQTVLGRGTALGPAELGLLATVGATRVKYLSMRTSSN